jgi:putative transcriptional regulator
MRKTKSAILEAVHETASGFYRAGAIPQTTMQEFEQLCSQPTERQAKKMKPTAKTKPVIQPAQ